jgi:epoxyqueuosine reductase
MTAGDENTAVGREQEQVSAALPLCPIRTKEAAMTPPRAPLAHRTPNADIPTANARRSVAADLASAVKDAALRLGFDAVGICDLQPVERTALRDWLERGYAATMQYMHRQATKRQEPARIAPGSTRAVMVLKRYYAPDPPDSARRARVARYAWGEDYHRVLGSKLAELAEALVALGADRSATRWYVDAGPVPERELAQRAGLGWIAKNTLLIHPRLGSFTFIAGVLTDLPLAVDEPFVADHCGSCRACLDACPTDAFPNARLLDAARCISYLTIEHRGAFSAAQGRMVGDWLFGCDVCQDVCPWNDKFAQPTDEPRFAPRPQLVAADPHELVTIDAAEFRRRYADTAFERPNRDGIARNAAQVIENGHVPGLGDATPKRDH